MKKISGNPFIQKENGKIFIDKVPLDQIFNEFKTPLLIFLEKRIRSNIQSFLNVFQSEFENFHCFYSFKANFLSEICKIALSEGIGAGIIGLPELKLALRLGFPSKQIIVGGPYLSKELIELCVKNRVKEIIIYDLSDLEKVNSIAKKYNYAQDICIRVNSQKYKSRLGVQFNEDKVSKFKAILNNYQNINIKSILSHFSTQMNDFRQFKTNIKALACSLQLLTKFGLKIDNINLGGGFPEATVMPQEQLRNLAKKIKMELNHLELDYKNIYFEPGRYFIGDAGLFISKIIKVIEDRWIFLNIGNHICPKFARGALRFYNASQIDESHKYKTSIAGIIPTDQDVLAKNYFFTRKLRKGDNVLITNTGAYSLTFSNRFPYLLPKILLVNENSYTVIFDPKIDRDFSLN